MARLQTLNNRLRTNQRPGLAPSLLRAGGSLAGHGFRIVSDAIHNEAPGLDMLTGPLGNVAGDLYKGLFGKNNRMGGYRPTAVRTSQNNKSGVMGALSHIAQTNDQILRTTSKTAQNTKEIKTTTFKQSVAAQQALILEKQKLAQAKFAKQMQMGKDGNTKYKMKTPANGNNSQSMTRAVLEGLLGSGFIGKLEAIGQGILGFLLLNPLKKTFASVGSLIGAVGRGGGKILGGGAAAIGAGLAAGTQGLFRGVAGLASGVDSKVYNRSKKFKRSAMRFMNEGSKKQKEAEEAYKLYQQERQMRVEKLRKHYGVTRMYAEDKIDKEAAKNKFDQLNILKERSSKLHKEHNAKFGADSKRYKKLFGDTPLQNVGDAIKKREASLKRADKAYSAVKGGVEGVGKFAKAGLEGAGKFLKIGKSIISKIPGAGIAPIAAAVAGITSGLVAAYEEVASNPEEWSKLKKTYKDKGLVGVLGDWISGDSPILSKGFSAGMKTAAKTLWQFTIGWIVDLVGWLADSIFGEERMQELKDSITKPLEKKAEQIKNWWKDFHLFGENENSQPNINTSMIKQQKQNEMLKAAKENHHPTSGSTNVVNNITAPNNSSGVIINNGNPDAKGGYSNLYKNMTGQ